MTDNPLSLAVFDCDGTLVDSQASIVHSMKAAFDHHGFDYPGDEAVRRVVGLPLAVAIRQLAENVDEALSEVVSETYKAAFFELRQVGSVEEPLYDGIAAVMDQLDAAGWLMGVATGKSHRGLVSTLSHHKILDRFVTHQTADRALGKPHPEMMFKALDEAGVDPTNSVMIGDTTFDMQMAQNAKVRAIGVSWGYHETEELMDAGAAQVVHSAKDLIEAILNKG
ncbi:HAD-IA family hydrolase [Magnetovibrio sp. PR-2]|uniref:HAD-IA family hydrolase n=1 Tax=Magnetovibrio sp. PR-2 TaxID=3120356 RepID=UPI002FCE4966